MYINIYVNILMYTCATPSNGLVAVIGLFEGWLQLLLPIIDTVRISDLSLLHGNEILATIG